MTQSDVLGCSKDLSRNDEGCNCLLVSPNCVLMVHFVKLLNAFIRQLSSVLAYNFRYLATSVKLDEVVLALEYHGLDVFLFNNVHHTSHLKNTCKMKLYSVEILKNTTFTVSWNGSLCSSLAYFPYECLPKCGRLQEDEERRPQRNDLRTKGLASVSQPARIRNDSSLSCLPLPRGLSPSLPRPPLL